MDEVHSVKLRMKRAKLLSRARRNRLAIRRLYKLFRFALVCTLVYFTWVALNSSHWDIPKNANIFQKNNTERLTIVGNSIVTDERILKELKKNPIKGKHIYLQNPKYIKNTLESLSPVRKAYVRRYWFPARYVIMVDEKRPLILISPSETSEPIAMYTACGQYIGREYLPLKHSYDTTLVLSYGTQGDDYEKWDVEKIKLFDKLAKSIAQLSGDNVLYIDVRKPDDVYVQTTNALLRVGELDYTVFKRIEHIKSIIPEIKNFNEKVKYVDLRWSDTRYLKLKNSDN